MGDERDDVLSFSFVKLQRLRGSFDEIARGHAPASERMLRRVARDLGDTAIPLLLRQLAAAEDQVGVWAQRLLAEIAADERCRPRVAREVRGLLRQPELGDHAKLRGLALLTELGATLPTVTEIDDIGALRQRSLRELAACLESPAEVARAADLLIAQLEGEELADFLDDFADGEPLRAAALLDELLLRDDLDRDAVAELRRLREPLADPPAPSLPEPRPDVQLGRHRDGSEVLVVTLRRDQRRPARYRVLTATIDPRGLLIDASYRPESTGGAINRQLRDGLEARGFALHRASPRLAARRLVRAAKSSRAEQRALPRDYYLGRDLLRITSEHLGLTPLRTGSSHDAVTALFARGMDLMSLGELRRSRPLLEQYVAACPDDPEGRSNLGICCLATDDLPTARTHLLHAIQLEPERALHYWNLASVAHRSNQQGACYLELSAYLERSDLGPDSDTRQLAARQFVEEYERLARVHHDGIAPHQVARADVSCTEARSLLEHGLLHEAIEQLEAALQLVPCSATAWRELGEAYLKSHRMPDARRCLRRAAALLPGDTTTLRLLEAAEK